MVNYQQTYEMKLYTVTDAIHAKYSDSQMAEFLEVARSFGPKARKSWKPPSGMCRL